MYKIRVSRTVEFRAPFDFVADSVEDWTHFSHLHRKSISGLTMLSKQGRRSVFLYKARRLYPLPIYDYYVVFREDRPEQHGFRNVYINSKTLAAHSLDVRTEKHGDLAVAVGEHLFSLPSYWSILPKIFMQAFLVLYKWRMDKILDEDFEWIYERMIKEGAAGPSQCAPAVPLNFDLLEQFFEKAPVTPDISFQYRVVENFDGKGRLKIKKPAVKGAA